MDLLIGVDDTDNLESRGTGYRVRQLANQLEENDLAINKGITRHQLFFSPLIPYTSHNSSACIKVSAQPENKEAIIDFCRNFLLQESAQGSDAGLCIAELNQISDIIRSFGKQAKSIVLNQAKSYKIAKKHNLYLEGLTGDNGGVIGALAAIGLRSAGNDGRYIGLKGIRELSPQTYSVAELFQHTEIETIRSLQGETLTDLSTSIVLHDWPRPVLLEGKATLLVEKINEQQPNEWHLAPKTVIKSY